MLAAMLRAKGIPARARCGFGTYFTPGRWEDHWVCEYWHNTAQQWIMVDAQLDAVQQEVLQITFDPLNMAPGHFVLAGEAWQLCRQWSSRSR
jgi:transglutaminase-like putative cysteine protease